MEAHQKILPFSQDGLLSRGGIEVSTDWESMAKLSLAYNIPLKDVVFIDFNRTGVYLPGDEVRVGYRVRFKTKIHKSDTDYYVTYFALPVRSRNDSSYYIDSDKLFYCGHELAEVHDLCLDTCDVSYSRGPNLLNINSRSRGSCRGCRACVHNYKNFYDSTVIKDAENIVSIEQIKRFFGTQERKGVTIPDLKQVAVVTGLFGSEESVVDHMEKLYMELSFRGFAGELVYFGCEVNSDRGLDRLSKLGNVTLIYAVDNFTKREFILSPSKRHITLEMAKSTLLRAKQVGINTTYAYIVGIDVLNALRDGIDYFSDCITKFPIINIYQVQTGGQLSVMEPDARKLEYYLQARQVIEVCFRGSVLFPVRWENFRPLWYETFAGINL